MKRSNALKLIANQLSFLNGTFNGVKDVFTPAEIASADVILTTMEEAGMQPPNIKLNQMFPKSECQVVEDNDYWYGCWEPEDETK